MDTGPNGYWARKERGKKDWDIMQGDLREDGAAPRRRLKQNWFTRDIDPIIKMTMTPKGT